MFDLQLKASFHELHVFVSRNCAREATNSSARCGIHDVSVCFLSHDSGKNPCGTVLEMYGGTILNLMYNFNQYISSTDRFGIPGSSEFEIHQLSRKLKFPVEDILRAVQEVGFNPDEIEEYIRDRYNRC
jgi:hypothetical protein